MFAHALNVSLATTCQQVQSLVNLAPQQDAPSVQTTSVRNALIQGFCLPALAVLARLSIACILQLVQLVRHAMTDFTWALTIFVTLASPTVLNARPDSYVPNVTQVTT